MTLVNINNDDQYQINNRATVFNPTRPTSHDVSEGPLPSGMGANDPRVNEDLFSYCECSG
jgi:hypothetical protein